jgi:hypothetical protein
MTIHVGQAIVFGLIGLVQGVILTMSYYDKRVIADLRVSTTPKVGGNQVAKPSEVAK